MDDGYSEIEWEGDYFSEFLMWLLRFALAEGIIWN